MVVLVNWNGSGGHFYGGSGDNSLFLYGFVFILVKAGSEPLRLKIFKNIPAKNRLQSQDIWV